MERIGETEHPQIKLIRIAESIMTQTLSGAVVTLQLLLRDGNLSPELFDSVYRTSLECRGSMAKISAIIELYGEEDITSSLRMSAYNLKQFLGVLVEQLHKALGVKYHGRISLEIDESVEDAVFDARRVCMILYHLVANAIQHGKTENKNVVIGCQMQDGVLELSVRDYGGGIPPQKKLTLFRGFMEQFDIQTLATGVFPPRIRGIGLPLCKKLTEDMQGEIRVKNYKTGAKLIVCIPQRETCLRAVSEYYPDDTLLLNCMADLLLVLQEEGNEQ